MASNPNAAPAAPTPNHNTPPVPQDVSPTDVVLQRLNVANFDQYAANRVTVTGKGRDAALKAEREHIANTRSLYEGSMTKVFDATRRIAEKTGFGTLVDESRYEALMPGSSAYADMLIDAVETNTTPSAEQQAFMSAMEARAFACESQVQSMFVDTAAYGDPADFAAAKQAAIAELIAEQQAKAAHYAATGQASIQADYLRRADGLQLYEQTYANATTMPQDDVMAASDYLIAVRSGNAMAMQTAKTRMESQQKRDAARAAWEPQIYARMQANLEAKTIADHEQAVEANTQALETLGGEVEALRTQLSALEGRRMRRSKDGEGNEDEYQDLRRDYDTAVRQLIAERVKQRTLEGAQFADDAELQLFIATETLQQSAALNEAKIEQYKTANKPLAKAINFLTGKRSDGTKETRKWVNRARKLTVAGVLIATAVTTGGAGTAVAAGALAGVKTYGALDAKASREVVSRTGGLLSEDEIRASIAAVPKQKRDPATGAMVDLTRDELIEASTAAATEAYLDAEQAQRIQRQRKRLGHIALGGGVGLLTGGTIGAVTAYDFGPIMQQGWDSFYESAHGRPNPSSPYTR